MSETYFSHSVQLHADELGGCRGALLLRTRPERPLARAPASAAQHQLGTVIPVDTASRLPGPAPGYRTELVRDFTSFLKLEPEWSELMDRSGMKNPFMRHEWIRAWWECFGQGKEMYILVARSCGQICAIAPLMLTRRPMYGIRVRRLEFIYNSHTPRCDFILDGGAEGALEAVWASLACTGDWQVMVLQQVPEDSVTAPAIASLAARDGFRAGSWAATEAPFVALSGNWDEFWRRLARKHRSNMRNRFRRLDRIGELNMEVASSRENLDGALRAGLAIEAMAWKGRAGTAMLSNPQVAEFYRKIAHAFARNGWLRLNFLRIGRADIAFDYSILHKNRIYVLKTGYDPAFGTYSPYNSLCWFKLRDAHERGIEEYDFLGSRDHWKMDWASQTRAHLWFFVFRDGLTGHALHSAKFRFIPALRRSPLYGSIRDFGVRVMTGIGRGNHEGSDE
jgi:CelD/BcsL family acetyltransferase involved in cellulose biosynthesis